MDKSIQAIDIAAVPSGNTGKAHCTSADCGETTPFAEVLSPAQENITHTGDGQAVAEDGNTLPGEQELPADQLQQALTGEARQASPLLTLTGEADQVSPLLTPEGGEVIAPLPGEAQPATVQLAVAQTDNSTTRLTAPVALVVNNTTEQPVAIADGKQVPEAGSRLQPVAVVPGEVASVVRDAAVGNNRVEPGVPAQTQPSQPAGSGSAGDATLDAVRAGVQQALAAQVAQDGLRQSLTGKERNGRLLTGIVTTTTTVETGVASFTPVLADATSLTGSARIAVPVGEAGWGRAVGEQVVWHVSQNIHAANLRLNPQHLGPLEMQVQMEGDKATLVFASQHAAVREALESALPRLREMFAQNGLDIVDVNVSQQNTSHREEQQAAAAGSQAVHDDEVVMSGEQPSGMVSRVTETSGLVDYYI